jgi:hypothetical protein
LEVAAGEVVTADGVAVVAVAPVADGVVALVPLAVLPVVVEVPVAVEGEPRLPAAVPDAEVPAADVPLELSVAEGVAALGVAVEVAGVLLVVALSDGAVDCACAMPARASAVEPIKSF